MRRLLQRLGLNELTVARDDWRRVVILLVVCVLCAVMVLDFSAAPTEALKVGDVAPRTVKVPFTFKYTDHTAYQVLRRDAADSVLPVFVHRVSTATELTSRVEAAFADARGAWREAQDELTGPGGGEGQTTAPVLTDHQRKAVTDKLVARLDVHLPNSDLTALVDAGFSAEAEGLVVQLLADAMQNLIIRDRDGLPPDRRAIRIIELEEHTRSEYVLTDLDKILTPGEARQQVSLGVLERKAGDSAELNAAATVARIMVRSNLSFDPLQTDERKQLAQNAVELELQTVKRGAILFRAGDTLDDDQVQVYSALQAQRSDQDVVRQLVALTLFFVLLLTSLYQFGANYLEGFSTRVRDVAAVGGLLVLTALLATIIVSSSEAIAALAGYEAEAGSVWFLVPVAGGAMLVRLLLGVSWTVMFSVAAASICGLLMDLQALPTVFFLLSGVAAAGAIEHSRERIAVLRAGVYVGVVNAAAVLLIHFVQLFIGDGELSMAATMRPFWSMSFGFIGGLASAFLVLGLVPAFEAVGFVTDYRLMELANLNHPLLRNLMLRAPGSYHHSIIVGTLAEAGCEAIGANALQAKVASYFHDIGKTTKPQYFVENQRDHNNKHAGLDPYSSAHIIISHVIDGGRMAKEYNLPQPIIDNIYMHHGTGLLQYFHHAAMAAAEDPSEVNEATFRYPGPKPGNREAGVIMLADKVEAATRTLQHPDEDNIRLMISRIVSSVIADGQFTECPLTFQEINTVAETFVSVLLGIYHQRIEYPQTADVSQSGSPEGKGEPAPVGRQPPKHAIITLELVPSDAGAHEVAVGGQGQSAERAIVLEADDESSDLIDYESLEHLPRGDH